MNNRSCVTFSTKDSLNIDWDKHEYRAESIEVSIRGKIMAFGKHTVYFSETVTVVIRIDEKGAFITCDNPNENEIPDTVQNELRTKKSLKIIIKK
ncbi:hypothetical protein LBMAG53_02750 [Planctomycetota bacterium]|nr:hypothetical protein LBMAG53_02750 [Planctomycetota bacterium]